MELTFRRAGFDVVDARHDLSALETRRAPRDFADKATDADIAVIYYAGHGLEVDGTNYLIPVDARLERHLHQSSCLSASDQDIGSNSLGLA